VSFNEVHDLAILSDCRCNRSLLGIHNVSVADGCDPFCCGDESTSFLVMQDETLESGDGGCPSFSDFDLSFLEDGLVSFNEVHDLAILSDCRCNRSLLGIHNVSVADVCDPFCCGDESTSFLVIQGFDFFSVLMLLSKLSRWIIRRYLPFRDFTLLR